MRFLPSAAACGLLLTFSAPVHAQRADPLPEMVVSANRFAQPGVTTPSSISVIGRAEIEASGALNVIDVLRGRGGVQVSEFHGDGSRAQVSLRGFGGNAAANTLVLVDGRRINNNDLGLLDFNAIALADVERIEIIQGSASVLFGDQAVGGVVNIITRRAPGPAVQGELAAGSFEAQRQRASLAHRLDNGLALRASGERRLSSNYRDNNDLQLVSGLVQALWEHDRGEVFAEFQHVEENLQLPGALFADELAVDRRQSTFPGDFTDTRTQVARAGVVQDLAAGWQFLGEVTNRWVDLDNQLTFFGTPAPFTQERRVTAFTPRLVGQWMLANGLASLTVGADVEDIHYQLASGFGLTESDQGMQSVYFQGVLPLAEGVSLTGGVRRAWYDNEVSDPFSPGSFEDTALASTVGLVWTPAEPWRVFLRQEHTYRFPLVDELTLRLNPTLETQRGRSYEAGVEWRQGRYSTKLVGYRVNLTEEIDYDSTVFSNRNLAPTTRTGLIAEAAVALLDGLHAGAEYSYIDAELDQPGGGTASIPFVARHSGLVWADWRPWGGWLVYGEVQGVSERIARSDYGNDFARLPGYVRANAHLVHRWSGWELGLRVANLLDKQYSDDAALGFDPDAGFAVDTGYYPAPERTWMLTLRVHL